MTLVPRTDRVMNGARRVETTPDYYIIRDSVAGRDGVYNRALRRARDLQKSYMTLEGKPIIVHHPPDAPPHYGLLAVFPGEIHGVVRNVRWNAQDKSIVYDAYLFRHTNVPGHETTSDVVAWNESIAQAISEGVPVDNSPGYMTRVTPEKGVWNGVPYDEVRQDFGYWHLAIVPTGACGWQDHCGMGRAQDTREDNDMTKPPTPDKSEDATAQLRADLDHLKTCAAKADEREAATKTRLDELATENKRLVQLLETRATAGDSLKPTPEFDALKKELDAVKLAQQRQEEAQKVAQDARLNTKRQKLATLRELKGDAAKALDAYNEAALDDAILREEAFRSRADGIQWGTPKASPVAGATIGVWDSKKGDYVVPGGEA